MPALTDDVSSFEISKKLDNNGWPLHRVASELLRLAVDSRDPHEIYVANPATGDIFQVVRNPDDIEIAHVPSAISVFNQLNTVDLVRELVGLRSNNAVVAYMCSNPLLADILTPRPEKKEADITYAIARTMQTEGRGLVAIATLLFGYSGMRAEGGEFYLSAPSHHEILAVTTDDKGLQIAHFPFGLSGRTQMNAARFVMEHANLKSPVDVQPYVYARIPVGRPDLA